MECKAYQPLIVEGLPMTLATFVNPWHVDLPLELLIYDGDLINIAIECESSAPSDFVMSVELGDAIRGVGPCSNTIGNTSVSLPLSAGPLTLNIDVDGSTSSEYLTLFTIYAQFCSVAQQTSPWWIYLIIGFFCLLAIAALYILCYKERAYNRIERANQRLEIHDSSY